MKPWVEQCLVLSPSFRATVMRDSVVVVEAEALDGTTKQWEFCGGTARAVQHEMDHDEGVLLLDHVGLEDMELLGVMREVEREDHKRRQARAFERRVVTNTGTAAAAGKVVRGGFWDSIVPSAYAEEGEVRRAACDEDCQKRIKERRELNRQSRSTSSRQEVFDLSRQRAALYNATYRGFECPPNVPCL